ncbi:hypothetical protein BDW71DRAFT_212025 [Aspergillus fruticulosus]
MRFRSLLLVAAPAFANSAWAQLEYGASSVVSLEVTAPVETGLEASSASASSSSLVTPLSLEASVGLGTSLDIGDLELGASLGLGLSLDSDDAESEHVHESVTTMQKLYTYGGITSTVYETSTYTITGCGCTHNHDIVIYYAASNQFFVIYE